MQGVSCEPQLQQILTWQGKKAPTRERISIGTKAYDCTVIHVIAHIEKTRRSKTTLRTQRCQRRECAKWQVNPPTMLLVLGTPCTNKSCVPQKGKHGHNEQRPGAIARCVQMGTTLPFQHAITRRQVTYLESCARQLGALDWLQLRLSVNGTLQLEQSLRVPWPFGTLRIPARE